MKISDDHTNRISVEPSTQISKDYYNNIKDFLAPIIQILGAKEVKRCGGKMKTCT